MVLTTFPGLVVRFGHWVVEWMPSCGCDACDEDPEYLVGQLADGVRALVAGDFTEQLTGGRRHPQLAYRLGDVEAEGQGVDARHDARLDGPTDHAWAAWPPAGA